MIYQFTAVGVPVVEAELKRIKYHIEKITSDYFLAGGTLLSLFRDKTLLPHDKDIDIGIIGEENLYKLYTYFKTLPEYTNVHITGMVESKILWVTRELSSDKKIIFELAAQYIGKDKIYYNREMGPCWQYQIGNCAWPKDCILPLASLQVLDTTFSVPGKTEEFLTLFYGSDWQTPKQYTDWRQNCPLLKEGWGGQLPVVMVAGGTHNIGAAIVNALEGNFRISLCGRSIVHNEVGENKVKVKCDITKKEELDNWLAITLKQFGYISALIYCVGGEYAFSPLLEIDTKKLEEISRPYIMAYINTLAQIIPIMEKQRDGYIINISSSRAISAAPQKGLYSAIKHAQKAITNTIPIEHPSIQVTSLHLGVVYSPRSIELYGEKLSTFPQVIAPYDIGKTICQLLSLSRNIRPLELSLGGVI